MAKLTSKKPSQESSFSLGKEAALNELKKEPTKKLNANIPESLHDKFKKKCIDEKVNMTDLIKEWIQNYIK